MVFFERFRSRDEGTIQERSNKEALYHTKTEPKQEKEKPSEIKTSAFAPSTTFAEIGKATRVASFIPQNGHQVVSMDRSQTFTLIAPVMTDHFSITYSTNQKDVYAKIYTQKALQIDLFEKKASRMVKENINIKGVCWPQAMLANTSGDFVGILVPASNGIQLTRSIFSGNSGISQAFPSWNKKDVCAVAHTIIDTICKLHRIGVYLGCLNPASIYVAGTTEVYFVDTDNWQIEGYPTLSRNITFTPPELISEHQKPHLFTKDEENYQVALLTFMLMMPGKYPYAKRKRGNDLDNIRDMSFPFSAGGEMRRSSDAERPSGAWQIIWDHLPYKMCNSFYNTFHSSGRFSKPGTRRKDSDWLGMVDEFYRNLSDDGNAESRKLMPKTFRRDEKRVFVKCSICGQEHPTFYFLRNIHIQNEKINIWDRGYRICLPCSIDQSDAYFTCKSCGRQFYYTNSTKIIHEIGRLNFDWSGQKWCHNCKKHTVKCSKCGVEVPVYQIKEFHDKRRNLTTSVCGACFNELLNTEKKWKEGVYKTQQCRQCGRLFHIQNGEAEYFMQKGMSLPSRCPVCRGRR